MAGSCSGGLAAAHKLQHGSGMRFGSRLLLAAALAVLVLVTGFSSVPRACADSVPVRESRRLQLSVGGEGLLLRQMEQNDSRKLVVAEAGYSLSARLAVAVTLALAIGGEAAGDGMFLAGVDLLAGSAGGQLRSLGSRARERHARPDGADHQRGGLRYRSRCGNRLKRSSLGRLAGLARWLGDDLRCSAKRRPLLWANRAFLLQGK